MNSAIIRPLAATDQLVELTALLHRAYARLGAMDLNFTAVDQTVAVTAERVARGQCFVAMVGDAMAGTVTVSRPHDPARSDWVAPSPWLVRCDTAHFGQLAVDPRFQGRRIGDALIARCEAWALGEGYARMLLDTAMPAEHLRTRYERLGYRAEDEVQWNGKRYRSVLMVKELGSVCG